MVTVGDANVWVTPAYRRPVTRRDAHNVLLRLDRDQALKLIHELTREFDGDVILEVYLTIEGGEVLPREVFD